MTNEKIEQLERRVEQLEQQLEAKDQTNPDNPSATRRGLLASAAGMAGLGALGFTGVRRVRAQNGVLRGIDQIGTSDERVSTIYADSIDSLSDDTTIDNLTVTNEADVASLSATVLSGDVVSRPEAIDNLEGNVYLEPEGTDPDTVLEADGDIVFLHGE